jgi:transcriptional regulator GlxA family with amidase domain
MPPTYVSKRLIGSGGAATLSIVSDVDIAVLAVDSCFDSGLSAVVDVLATANALRGDVPVPPAAFTVTIVGLKKQVRTGNGLIVNPVLARKMAQLPDLLIMPALGVKTPAEIIDTVRGHAALNLIRDSHADGAELAGACTGTFFLAESGVLDGRLATTSCWLGPAFRSQYPAVLLDETRIIARDARITTAGAAFAHIDLALSIVQQHSPSLANLTARYLLIGDHPSQAAFAMPALLARADPTMATFERWVRQRLSEPLQVSAAARDLGISERTLQRTTASVVGMSPLTSFNRSASTRQRSCCGTHRCRRTPLRPRLATATPERSVRWYASGETARSDHCGRDDRQAASDDSARSFCRLVSACGRDGSHPR